MQDEVERDLIEEINARTKFPITKQDSYGHAIYHGAKKTKNVRKQGTFISTKYCNFSHEKYPPPYVDIKISGETLQSFHNLLMHSSEIFIRFL